MGMDSGILENLQSKAHYKLAWVTRTARDTQERFSEVSLSTMAGNKAETAVVRIDPQQQFQTILGFGGAFTEAGAYVLGQIAPEKRQEIIDAYFSPASGLNYTMGRVHMNSCDFSLGNYSCDDTDGDLELRDFNIDRDREGLIPFLKDALKSAGAPIRLLVSPWSPPGWMKTNEMMNHGGSLKKEYRETWARFYTKFIRAYEQEGIPVWGVSVQNEPEATQTWDSCLYTAEEEGEFVRDYLGPQLQKDGYGQTKILIWDHNRDRLYERASATLADPKTAQFVWGIGFHWYSGDQFENVERTYRRFPDKPLIFTEGCLEKGVKMGSWDRGEIYAHNMIGDFNSGMAAWMDWNMVLNQIGGPNHVGNYCDAPVIADTETGVILYQSSYYYIGHFSKYVQAGAKRIGCYSDGGSIEAVAFLNPDQRIVVIAMNRQDQDLQLILEIKGESVSFLSLKHSIQTLLFQ